MIWADTTCECSECHQAWYLDGNKWVWLSKGRSAPVTSSDVYDPYDDFSSRYD